MGVAQGPRGECTSSACGRVVGRVVFMCPLYPMFVCSMRGPTCYHLNRSCTIEAPWSLLDRHFEVGANNIIHVAAAHMGMRTCGRVRMSMPMSMFYDTRYERQIRKEVRLTRAMVKSMGSRPCPR